MFEQTLPLFYYELGRYIFRESIVIRKTHKNKFPSRDLLAFLMKVYGMKQEKKTILPQPYRISMAGLIRALAVLEVMHPELFAKLMTVARLLDYVPSDYLFYDNPLDYEDIMDHELVRPRWEEVQKLFPAFKKSLYKNAIERAYEEYVRGRGEEEDPWKEYTRLSFAPPIRRRQIIEDGETATFLSFMEKKVSEITEELGVPSDVVYVVGRRIIVDENAVAPEKRKELAERLEEAMREFIRIETSRGEEE